MIKNYLDEVIDRSGTCSVKWDPQYLKEQFGREDILPMWVADMDFKCPQPIIDAIQKRAEHGIFGYTFRDDAYLDSIVNWFDRRHNWKVEKDWIVFTPGIVNALNQIVQAFTMPGDKVLIQRPVYYPFTDSIENNGRRVINNPLSYDDGKYSIDFDDFEKKIKDPYVKLFVLCNPHNPVGRVWTKDELTRMGRLCLKNDVLVISDEIHCDLVLFNNVHIPMQSINKAISENTITCTAPSKTFNIAGLQTSNIIIPNQGHRERLNQHLVRNAVELTNVFGLVGMTAAYNECEEWLDDVKAYLENNVKIIEEFVNEHIPTVRFIKPEGTYLGWLDFREVVDPKELDSMLIDKAKVAMDGGNWFGNEGKGFARINFACPKEILLDGLNRIAKAINEG